MCRLPCVLVVLGALGALAADTHVTTTSAPSNSSKEILKASETSDPAKVDIVKQIRRVNEDGSYTIGYEAGDGTFKIENRDVLGNVKGTFGYVDRDGEVKRVTYSSSSDSTPVPVPVTTPSPRNHTTPRRPLPTLVYPTRAPLTPRTVIQPIPRRRNPVTPSTKHTDTTTERQHPESTTSNILNLYKSKTDEPFTKIKAQVLSMSTTKDDLVAKQTTSKIPTSTVKPVYEETEEKAVDKAPPTRRELSDTGGHMRSLQQSAGDDSTDVYGSHLSLGTVRPLFTTTTPRPRLVPIHSLVAARQHIQQHYQDDQETTIEASTGRVFDQENVVTSNPVPVVHIPPREPDERTYQVYRRPVASVHFRTREYLRDNPGAPVPIGNQRPFLPYEYQKQVLEQQYVKEPPHTTATAPEAATASAYDSRAVTRIIPVAVDERGVPLQGYQARFVNPYRPVPRYEPRYEPLDEMNSIAAPVSTRDLKRLLQVLISRQNRLQSLMDQIVAPGPPYAPLPAFRDERYQPRYDDDRYDYRYDHYRQEPYSNQVANYDNQHYESQRFSPRRRLYTRPYDAVSSSSNHLEETPEFLPPEIREALLLKMLMLAISPDFMPTPAPPATELTPAPPRKQVRNVQVLGVEGATDNARNMPRH